jgi:hypothetical protein
MNRTPEQEAEDVKKFLKELTNLSKKYKISISGCGCCGSPYLNTKVKIRNDDRYVVDTNLDHLGMKND